MATRRYRDCGVLVALVSVESTIDSGSTTIHGKAIWYYIHLIICETSSLEICFKVCHERGASVLRGLWWRRSFQGFRDRRGLRDRWDLWGPWGLRLRFGSDCSTHA